MQQIEAQSQRPPTNRLQIDYLNISQIKPGATALRVHSKMRIGQLAASIQAFGCNLPLLVDANHHLIAGHGLFEALKSLGWTEVPVIIITHLRPEQTRSLSLALNRLGETGKWDEAKLAIELKSLSELDLDFSLETTGFSMAEIDLKIEGLNEGDNDDHLDALPDFVDGPAVTKLGDLWLLGDHRLYVDSALETTSYQALMAGKQAAQVNTDPPYNIPINGFVSGLGKNKHSEFVEGYGEKSPEEFGLFLRTMFKNLAAHAADGALLYATMDWRHAEEILAAARLNELNLMNICVWVKPNAGMGSLYRSQNEFVFVFKKGVGPHQNNIQLGRFGRNRSNVWHYAAVPGFGREGDEGNLAKLHPTPKPVRMIADAILDTSKRGDIILDPFLGSGTTLIAAQRVGRRCFGMELDPLYADCVIRRWQAFTGEKAVHAATGEPFEAVAATRAQEPCNG
jgi:DNA modification methylase